ncbi:hypothetical protein RSAG8_02009, partial [Rhizoctonia solani AG-8 WAC10335]
MLPNNSAPFGRFPAGMTQQFTLIRSEFDWSLNILLYSLYCALLCKLCTRADDDHWLNNQFAWHVAPPRSTRLSFNSPTGLLLSSDHK